MSDKEILDWLEEELKQWRTGMLHTEAPSAKPEWLYFVETQGRYDKATTLRAAIKQAMRASLNHETQKRE